MHVAGTRPFRSSLHLENREDSVPTGNTVTAGHIWFLDFKPEIIVSQPKLAFSSGLLNTPINLGVT